MATTTRVDPHVERAVASLKREVFTWRLVSSIVWSLPAAVLVLLTHALVLQRLSLAPALAALGSVALVAAAVRWVMASVASTPPHVVSVARAAHPAVWGLLGALGLLAHCVRLAVVVGPPLLLSCHEESGAATHCVQVG